MQWECDEWDEPAYIYIYIYIATVFQYTGVGLYLHIYFISIRTWVLFINNVRKFVVCASIELECCGGRLQRLLARINSTERRSGVAILHINECCLVYRAFGRSYACIVIHLN